MKHFNYSLTTVRDTNRVPFYKNAHDKNKNNKKQASFGNAPEKVLYEVKNATALKKIIPVISCVGSIVSATGYLVGSLALFYDSKKEKELNRAFGKKRAILASKEFGKFNTDITSVLTKQIKDTKEHGVKTITPTTKIGEIGLKFGKVGVAASASAGVACGLAEGMPTMALGEATNIGAASIIETPIGTGLFGIGIASIFSALALNNTPELKLNQHKFMAAKNFTEKSKIVGQNIKATLSEIMNSVGKVIKNIYKPIFIKEAFFKGTPTNVMFTERINKDGKSTISRALRHNRNYMMHAASFTLGLGGVGVILASLFKSEQAKKAQKTGLVVEEGGFLLDNLGMTRMGLDSLTTGARGSGSAYTIGGVINALSQFIGLDNKDGRATQWLGIALVFTGFGIDRGKHLKETLKNAKFKPELTDVIREWKVDLSKIIENKADLKKLLSELKNGKDVTNETFKKLESAFTAATQNEVKNSNKENVYVFKTEKTIEEELRTTFGSENFDKYLKTNMEPLPRADFEETKDILKICSEKTFGKEPKKIKPPETKKANK